MKNNSECYKKLNIYDFQGHYKGTVTVEIHDQETNTLWLSQDAKLEIIPGDIVVDFYEHFGDRDTPAKAH